MVGTVTVPTGRELEVFNFGMAQGQILVDCNVSLLGEDSELNLAEDTDLLFQCTDAAVIAAGLGASCAIIGEPVGFKNFTITVAGGSFEIELQVKKNSTIEAKDFTMMVVGAEEDS